MACILALRALQQSDACNEDVFVGHVVSVFANVENKRTKSFLVFQSFLLLKKKTLKCSVCGVSVWVCSCKCKFLRRLKSRLASLELELQVGVSHLMWVTGPELSVLEKMSLLGWGNRDAVCRQFISWIASWIVVFLLVLRKCCSYPR